MEAKGIISHIAGPVVSAKNMSGSQMYELVRVGSERLIGEIIRIEGDKATIQVYEETSGLRPGEAIERTGKPLSAELGPGLISQIYDGIQRPLPSIQSLVGSFFKRGVVAHPLDRSKKWKFIPAVKVGAELVGGDILGTVQETPLVTHKILVPPNVSGKVVDITEGSYSVDETVASLEGPKGIIELPMMQSWPVRISRPYKRKVPSDTPLLTGQRIFDTFFPMAKGGQGAIPGGFGTGKTVMLHQLAQWADAHVVIYVGCGERGNEMADVLESFPKLKDPRSGQPLMTRTVLIANTSNMPIAAREASVYTGITMAEYFRDMGYDVALMADSTSRWAEALREISGRLEEMPGEEGYPAYLASRLSEFYERAGRVETLGREPRLGSISVVGAVSPPGADFSEPVTQNTLRIIKVFWGLDKSLAERRHFPAINWLTSYSLYHDSLDRWYTANVDSLWASLRTKALELLQKEDELKEIVRLVGPDALSESQRALLEAAKMIREDFLMQSAFHPIDSYCSIRKCFLMLRAVINFYDNMLKSVERGIQIKNILSLPIVEEIARMKLIPPEKLDETFKEIDIRMADQFNSLVSGAGRETA
ncbi:MAG: V-type ATP synthase subunit A [Candidatus Bathyarchaeia archaeon]